jgi:predicted anti-sigma-YlaC factor YlaD
MTDMLNCHDISKLISRSLDERLSWKLRLAIRAHLLYCKFCRQFAKQANILSRTTAQYADRLAATFEDQLTPEQRAHIGQNLRHPDADA